MFLLSSGYSQPLEINFKDFNKLKICKNSSISYANEQVEWLTQTQGTFTSNRKQNLGVERNLKARLILSEEHLKHFWPWSRERPHPGAQNPVRQQALNGILSPSSCLASDTFTQTKKSNIPAPVQLEPLPLKECCSWQEIFQRIEHLQNLCP